jgi:hypothetical protein
MTECDALNDLATLSANLIELNSAQASYIAIYLSAVFAYIVAAYTAGASLTRFQVALSNALFVLFSVVIVSRIVSLGLGMNRLTAQVAEIQGQVHMDQFILVDQNVRLGVSTLLWSTGVLFALAFMWSVRHPRGE